MRLRHVAHQQLRRLLHRYAFLRRISTTTTALTVLWLYVLYWGERSVFRSHVDSCAWENWEEWPREATPHHLVLIADPQLVDPHTYPGRPWPLSTLTEKYTDQYMSRNYRLINANLDPDTIIFLGDLFDGGREWAPDKARQLKTSQRRRLEDLGVLPPKDGKSKRDLEKYKGTVEDDHLTLIAKEEKAVGPTAEGLKTFVPGENGRWSKWSGKQWMKDFERFSSIFFAPQQLYPESQREMFAAFDVLTNPISVENGAANATWQEYATSGGKSRRVITSLPGNHDLGFGAGVQLVVRDRFQSHFGDPNRIDIIGNHTFISLDTPSLSAHNQYMSDGFESTSAQYLALKHLWKPSMDFLNNLRHPLAVAEWDYLTKFYPQERRTKGWAHEVTDPGQPHGSSSAPKTTAWTYHSKSQLPIMLLTHVPLYRNPDSECGPLRERGNAIPVTFGYQYQNVLTQTLSRDIITKISSLGEIAMAFSGDDHDYCDMPHKYNIPLETYSPVDAMKTRFARVREITVKSFSWAMGIREPGFLLVSLWNPIDAQGNTIGTPLPTVQTHLCLLPDQLGIFIDYGLLLMLTIPVILVRAIVVGLRDGDNAGFEDVPLTPTRSSLPRFQVNGTPTSYKSANGNHSGVHSTSHSRHNSSNTNGGHLGVQRSHNARTRSVSPTYGGSFGSPQITTTNGPLIDKAGFFPQVKWTDPSDADDDSDEERSLGGRSDSGGWIDDSQAKWKWRRRTPGRARKCLDEFGVSMMLVGVPALVWYFWLIKNG